MLMPKRLKHPKEHRGRMRGLAYRGSTIAFGEYGLQALEPSWIDSRQIESARVAMTRYFTGPSVKAWPMSIFPLTANACRGSLA